jgi:hypothetical protein
LLEATRKSPVVRVHVRGQSKGLHQLRDIHRVSVEGPERLQDLTDADLGRKRALLQLDPDPLSHLVPVSLRVQTQHPDRPAVGHPQPCDAFHGGGLARPVRPHDTEDLRRSHTQIETIHSDYRAIRLVRPPDIDHRHDHIPQHPPRVASDRATFPYGYRSVAAMRPAIARRVLGPTTYGNFDQQGLTVASTGKWPCRAIPRRHEI